MAVGESARRAALAADLPVGALQRPQYVAAFNFLQSGLYVAQGHGLRGGLVQGIVDVQHVSACDDDRPFNHVLQLANIARPRVSL